ncbi:Allergen Asp f [Lachnellula suecica]|uniref:Allergen Asp f n=1 Tax=Lachnellula suecica TaxID=602035 RepID=A0A8T9CBN2_9HELO|nr:Allergen Asp f [Lachnellula suecica]
MRYSTASTTLLVALIGQVAAGPTPGHVHAHRRVHEKKEAAPVVENAAWWSTVINWKTVNYGGSSTEAAAPAATNVAANSVVAAPATATTSAAKKEAQKSATKAASVASSAVVAVESSVSSAVADVVSSSSSVGLLNSLVGVANALTGFGEATAEKNCPGINCIGNVGSPYGSNIIKVSSTSGYDYTNTFTNTQSSSITINIWNKPGSDGQANSGQALAPKDTTLTFVLGAGDSQIVAFMNNTSGGWAQATTALNPNDGSFDATWGEYTFIDNGNAWDVSAIQNTAGNNYNMAITGNGCTSNMEKNMWVTASSNKNANGVNVAPSDANCVAMTTSLHLTTTMGGTA